MYNKMISTLLMLLSFSLTVNAQKNDSQKVSEQADRVMTELSTWDNQKLKQQLMLRISENQYLIRLLHELDMNGEKTEIDRMFNSYVQSLLEDQHGLSFVGSHLASIDKKEQLNLDAFLMQNQAFNEEVVNSLNINLRSYSSHSVLSRVLYYSLMEKYRLI